MSGDVANAGGGRVAIVGGGLAGLAAAVGLADAGVAGEIFEARRYLGGRATSFADPASGETVDHCQHVSMGCCTNLADFCRRTGTSDLLRRDRELTFFTRDGRQSRLRAAPLPAPLHLAPSFLRLHYLPWRDRVHVARAMLRLARTRADELRSQTVAAWLARQGQSPAAIERFWGTVLVSALGESIERASMLHAQKVFVDAFLAAPTAYEVYVPQVPLGELYGGRLTAWLARHNVALRLASAIERIDVTARGVSVACGEEEAREFDAAIVAVPWQRVKTLLAPSLAARLPEIAGLDRIDAAPITGVHLWFDRAITELHHAVLVDMLSQWLFSRPDPQRERGAAYEHYYQVVISASRHIAGRDRAEVVAEICDELRDVFPAAGHAKLLRWKMVTDPAAVFSVRPGIEELRPPQQTSVERLFLAGDWTRTGWPATMEGAVRSGYLAAEAVLRFFGRHERLLVPDLPRGWLARWLLRSN